MLDLLLLGISYGLYIKKETTRPQLDDSEKVSGETDAKANLVNLPPSIHIRISCLLSI